LIEIKRVRAGAGTLRVCPTRAAIGERTQGWGARPHGRMDGEAALPGGGRGADVV